jgi:transcriptional regulator with XRE-family HTH domain
VKAVAKFGEFIKEHRMKKDYTLREFCNKFGHDPSNWSKLERGLLKPPSDKKTLSVWAKQLGLAPESTDWFAFHDLAYTSRGEIPSDILSEDKIVEKLPLFFRTFRGQKPTKEELKQLINIIRRNEKKGEY